MFLSCTKARAYRSLAKMNLRACVWLQLPLLRGSWVRWGWGRGSTPWPNRPAPCADRNIGRGIWWWTDSSAAWCSGSCASARGCATRPSLWSSPRTVSSTTCTRTYRLGRWLPRRSALAARTSRWRCWRCSSPPPRPRQSTSSAVSHGGSCLLPVGSASWACSSLSWLRPAGCSWRWPWCSWGNFWCPIFSLFSATSDSSL